MLHHRVAVGEEGSMVDSLPDYATKVRDGAVTP
jgi:hypothetical protein